MTNKTIGEFVTKESRKCHDEGQIESLSITID